MRFFIAALILLAVCAWARSKYVCKYNKDKTYRFGLVCDGKCMKIFYKQCLDSCRDVKKSIKAMAQDQDQDGEEIWRSKTAIAMRKYFHIHAQDEEGMSVKKIMAAMRGRHEYYSRGLHHNPRLYHHHAQDEEENIYNRDVHVEGCKVYCGVRAATKRCREL